MPDLRIFFPCMHATPFGILHEFMDSDKPFSLWIWVNRFSCLQVTVYFAVEYDLILDAICIAIIEILKDFDLTLMTRTLFESFQFLLVSHIASTHY